MKKKLLLVILLVVVLLPLAGLVVIEVSTLDAMPRALSALESDGTVRVEYTDMFTFRPVDVEPDVGLVLYPGGLVDPRAYAPTARELAARGYLVIVVPMPLDLAVLAPDRALSAIGKHTAIEHWAVGGHSLGGAMAAGFADKHAELVDGLVLWAAYPASSVDLSGAELSVVSISATRDGLSTPVEILQSRPRLPEDTTWVEIEGGNHAQFGWYGPQRSDRSATISRDEQQNQIIEASVSLLQGLPPGN